LNWVVNLKENQPELLAESERVISRVAAEKMNRHPELQLWHALEVYSRAHHSSGQNHTPAAGWNRNSAET